LLVPPDRVVADAAFDEIAPRVAIKAVAAVLTRPILDLEAHKPERVFPFGPADAAPGAGFQEPPAAEAVHVQR
jgi:hypothetical protein